jgi:hypothetical protein
MGGDAAKVVRCVIYYPVVSDAATLADLVNRASWYLPQSEFSQVEVSIPVSKEFLSADLKTLVPPASQFNYIGRSNNIHLVDQRVVDLSQADVILLWNKTSMLEPRILRHLATVSVVDPLFYGTVEGTMARKMYSRTLDSRQKERFSALSKANYRSLLGTAAGCKEGYVFGTGPTIERAEEFNYDLGFKVVCNTIVKNKTLLRHIQPQLLAFIDPVFFFSPCRYAAEFRRMVLDTVREFHCYIMVPDYNVPLLMAHYPELESYIIGMPVPDIWDMSLWELVGMALRRPGKMEWTDKIAGHKDKYNFPSESKFYVAASTSILTQFMLPIVSSFCEKIYVIGADGRKPDENYYWTHSSASQLGDLMQTIFDTHPSFFRDALYVDQYEEYCAFFEGLVEYGESLGKRYYSLTPSYIPALTKRPAPVRDK